MDTPETTLLVVLQVVSAMLTILMAVAARQARQRAGPSLWVVAFAVSAISQMLREIVSNAWGHQAGLSIGHLGGPLAYMCMYLGIRRYLGLSLRLPLACIAFAVAAALSITAVSHGSNYASLAMTSLFTALFQSLAAMTFWQLWRTDGGTARISACATFVLSAAAAIGRAVSLVPAWHLQSTLLPSNVDWLLVFIALNILQAGALLFLVNQSLLDALQDLADYDALTGLLNRRGLARRVRRPRSRPHAAGPMRMGMLCMDLDHFKAVNDVHGHGAGDDVLEGFGRMLRDNCRPRDTAVRQGGEEFGLVVEAASDEELLALAERHRAAVECEPFATRIGPIPVTISVGAALAHHAGETLEEIGERADQSLLAAKRAGRNRVVMSPGAAMRPSRAPITIQPTESTE